MDIEFSSRSLQRACSSEKELTRRWGKDRGRTIGRRLQQLAAAETLKVFGAIVPAKLHPLKGQRAGQFGVDADYPYRLILEPNQHPIPRQKDGGIDLANVRKIKILEVVDYHGD